MVKIRALALLSLSVNVCVNAAALPQLLPATRVGLTTFPVTTYTAGMYTLINALDAWNL